MRYRLEPGIFLKISDLLKSIGSTAVKFLL